MNIVFARNTMSAEIIKAIEEGHQFPWLRVENGKLTEASKKAADEMFLKLGGRVFFRHVEPMKSRSKAPRRGWGELVSELVAFSRKARDLARHWQGESGVQTIAQEIRKVSGFGGKGFRITPRKLYHHTMWVGLRPPRIPLRPGGSYRSPRAPRVVWW